MTLVAVVTQALVGRWSIWPVAGALALVLLARAALARRRLAAADLGDVDGMDGTTFVRLLALRLRALGYRVERVRGRDDHGADLLLELDGWRTAVRARRQSRELGSAPVDEVAGARDHYRCDEALVVTTGALGPRALARAAARGVELWDREELHRRLAPPAPEAAVLGRPVGSRS